MEEQIKVLTEIKTLLKAGDEDKALNILNLNLSKELTNPADFYLTRAKILLKRGQNSEALKDFEAFIQNSPKHPEASSVQEKIEGLKDKLKK